MKVWKQKQLNSVCSRSENKTMKQWIVNESVKESEVYMWSQHSNKKTPIIPGGSRWA